MNNIVLNDFLNYIDADTKITLYIGSKKISFIAHQISCSTSFDKYADYKVTYVKADGDNKMGIYAKRR